MAKERTYQPARTASDLEDLAVASSLSCLSQLQIPSPVGQPDLFGSLDKGTKFLAKGEQNLEEDCRAMC